MLLHVGSCAQVPPLFGLDSIHGANYVADAVMYPHALHTAASFKVEHAHNAARSAARHTRASGIGWVFAPVLDLPMNSRFPRVYESCGEDPVLIAAFAVAMVQGLQGMQLDVAELMGHSRLAAGTQNAGIVSIPEDLSADDVVAACMKHFVACVPHSYSLPLSSQTNTHAHTHTCFHFK
jgi:beta-glucosidase-like glycosyl hydrolase